MLQVPDRYGATVAVREILSERESDGPWVSSTRVTLQQVADRAGVSRTTASFVLTGRRDMRISAAAEERVLKASRELDYRPSLVARALMNYGSQTIGLISDLLATEPFAGEAIRGALDTAVLKQHMLFVGET